MSSRPFQPRATGNVEAVPNSRRALDLMDPDTRFVAEFGGELAAQLEHGPDALVSLQIVLDRLVVFVGFSDDEPEEFMVNGLLASDLSRVVVVRCDSAPSARFDEGTTEQLATQVREYLASVLADR